MCIRDRFFGGNGKTAQLCAGRSFYVLLIKRLVRLEERGYGAVFEDLVDGTSQQRSNRKNSQVGPALSGLRKGVSGDDFLSTTLGQTLASRVGEDAVGTSDNDGLRASFLQDADSAGDGSAGIDHVVEQDAVLALDLADNAVRYGLVSNLGGTGLVNEGQWSVAKLLSLIHI